VLSPPAWASTLLLQIMVRNFRVKKLLLLAALLCVLPAPILASEKVGMPDLSQVEQTCLPTSTANLILWFGHHGYPKLIATGTTEDERDLHTVHRIMAATNARFDLGTPMDAVTSGIEKYIRSCGYDCDAEYRGLDGKGPAFSRDWLEENDGANKGFILLLAYCHYDSQTGSVSPAWNAGHAVTLVNYEPDTLLINDPAHQDDETGRKILSTQVLADASWHDAGGTRSAAGLLLLTGSLLEAPPASQVLLAGAVCVTIRPPADEKMVAPERRSDLNQSAKVKGASAGHHSGWIDWLIGMLGYN
jgi:hypothetical protein